MNTDESKVIGTGAILRSSEGRYFFQKRDEHAPVCPSRIAPFGGGIEAGESDLACIVRELREELSLEVDENNLIHIDYFESDNTPGVYLSLFLLDGVVFEDMVLHEGEGIASLTLKEALENELVTDFTKRVLGVLHEKGM
jgi:8-oxo-dGTP pyrophosphatase MutT (NUDIX family)